MSHLKALVMMQLKDKINFGFVKNKKSALFKAVFFVLRFLVVAAIAYLTFYLIASFKLVSSSPIVDIGVPVIIITIILLLTTLSCTLQLNSTLYFAPDNRVLVTFPVPGNIVFLSKLIVFYLFELIRSLTFTLPILIAYGAVCSLNWFYFLWLPFCMIFISALPVVFGALFSIPFMFIYRFIRKYRALGAVLFVALVSLFILAVVGIINSIPDTLDLINQWPVIKANIRDFLDDFRRIFKPFDLIMLMLVGKKVFLEFIIFRPETFIIFAAMAGIIAVVFAVVFFASRPLFFVMTSKPFEYEKKTGTVKMVNRRHNKYVSFFKKELLTEIRSSDSAFSRLAVAIAVPIMILLLNKIFVVMDMKQFGLFMSYSFNLLFILLPTLACNSLLAKAYSEEGKAGYLKKTFPTGMVAPLVLKLIVPLCLSVISVTVATAVFQVFARFDAGQFVCMLLTVLLVDAAHMLWSAEHDVMNPQNEQYDTAGGIISNPNETKATILAFVLSFAVFAVSMFLFNENAASALVKCCLLAAALFASRLYMFVAKIKLFYIEKQG